MWNDIGALSNPPEAQAWRPGSPDENSRPVYQEIVFVCKLSFLLRGETPQIGGTPIKTIPPLEDLGRERLGGGNGLTQGAPQSWPGGSPSLYSVFARFASSWAQTLENLAWVGATACTMHSFLLSCLELILISPLLSAEHLVLNK